MANKDNVYEVKIKLEGEAESLKRQMSSLSAIARTLKVNTDENGNIMESKAVTGALGRNKKIQGQITQGTKYTDAIKIIEKENQELEKVLQERIRLIEEANQKIKEQEDRAWKEREKQYQERVKSQQKKVSSSTLDERWEPKSYSSNKSKQVAMSSKSRKRTTTSTSNRITMDMINPSLDAQKGFKESDIGKQASQRKLDAASQVKVAIENIRQQAEQRMAAQAVKDYQAVYNSILEGFKKDELQLQGVKPRGKGGNYSKAQLDSVVLDDLQLKQVEDISKKMTPAQETGNLDKLLSLLQKQADVGGQDKSSLTKLLAQLQKENESSSTPNYKIELNKKRILTIQEQLKNLEEIETLLQQVFTKTQAKQIKSQVASSMKEVRKSIEDFDELESEYQRLFSQRKYQNNQIIVKQPDTGYKSDTVLAHAQSQVQKGKKKEYQRLWEQAQEKLKKATSYKGYQNGQPTPGVSPSVYKEADKIILGNKEEPLTEKEMQTIFESILIQEELSKMSKLLINGSPINKNGAYFTAKSYPSFNKDGHVVSGAFINEKGELEGAQSLRVNSQRLQTVKDKRGKSLSGKSIYQLEEIYNDLEKDLSAGGEKAELAQKVRQIIIEEIAEALANTKNLGSIGRIEDRFLRREYNPETYDPENVETDPTKVKYQENTAFASAVRGQMLTYPKYLDRPSNFESGIKYDPDAKRFVDQETISQEMSKQNDPEVQKKEERKAAREKAELEVKRDADLLNVNNFVNQDFTDALQNILKTQGVKAAKEFVRLFLSQIRDDLKGNVQEPQAGVNGWAGNNVELMGLDGSTGKVLAQPDYNLLEELEGANQSTEEAFDVDQIEEDEKQISTSYKEFVRKILEIVKDLRQGAQELENADEMIAYGNIQSMLEKMDAKSGAKDEKTIEQNLQESFNRAANILSRAKVTDLAMSQYSQVTGQDPEKLLQRSFDLSKNPEESKARYETSQEAREKFNESLIKTYGNLDTAEEELLKGNLQGIDEALAAFFSVRDKEIEEVYQQVNSLKGDPELYEQFKEGLINQLFSHGRSKNSQEKETIRTIQPNISREELNGLSIKERFIGGFGQGQLALAPYGATNATDAVAIVEKLMQKLLSKEEFTEQDEIVFDKLAKDLELFENAIKAQEAEYAGVTEERLSKLKNQPQQLQQGRQQLLSVLGQISPMTNGNTNFLQVLQRIAEQQQIQQQQQPVVEAVPEVVEQVEQKVEQVVQKNANQVAEAMANQSAQEEISQTVESGEGGGVGGNGTIPPSSNNFSGGNYTFNIDDATINVKNGYFSGEQSERNNNQDFSNFQSEDNDLPFSVEDYPTNPQDAQRWEREGRRREYEADYERISQIRSPSRNGILDNLSAEDAINDIDDLSEFDTHTIDDSREAVRQYNQELKNQIKALGEVAKYQQQIANIEKEIENLRADTNANNEQQIANLEQQLTLLRKQYDNAQDEYTRATEARFSTQVDQGITNGNLDSRTALQVEQMRTNAEIEAQRIIQNARSSTNVQSDKQDLNEQSKLVKQYIAYYKEQLKIEREIEKVKLSMQGQEGEDLKNSQNLLNALSQQRQVLQSNAIIYDEQRGELNGIVLTDANRLQLQQQINKLNAQQETQLIKINNSQKQQVSLIDAIVGGLRASFRNLTDYTIAYEIIGQIRGVFNSILSATKQLDANLVDIQIASGMTAEQVHQTLIDYSDIAHELGKTTSDVATAANDWLRAGYEGQEAAELTKASMELAALGMIDSADATTYLISTLKGWKLAAEDVEGVVDRLVSVDMAAAISAGKEIA